MSRLEHESHLDDVLEKTGSQLEDHLDVHLSDDSILGAESLQYGLMSSLRLNWSGVLSGTVRDMEPHDHPYQMDIPSSHANDRPMARKKKGNSTPLGLHVVLDTPERLRVLTGDYDPRSIGNFMLGLSHRLASESGSEVFVHAIVDGEARTVYEGYADDMYSIHQVLRGERKPFNEGHRGEPTTRGLLALTASQMQEGSDAALIVSDLQDGFDAGSAVFDWEEPLRTIRNNTEDRTWTTRFTSPAHRTIPYGVLEGIDDSTIDDMNRRYAPLADAKEARIEQISQTLPHHVDVGLVRQHNDAHPVRVMTKHILGQS